MRPNEQITATVVLDSVNAAGDRVTTMHLRAPYRLLPELNTHKLPSRNAASSRAKKSLDLDFVPSWWGSVEDAKGMAATKEIGEGWQLHATRAWLGALNSANYWAEELKSFGVHQQHYNGLLTPFAMVDVLWTAVHEHHLLSLEMGAEGAPTISSRAVRPWEDIIYLRTDEAAQPEIRDLFAKVGVALDKSTPMEREHHLPFMIDPVLGDDSRMVSAARCARVSYGIRDDYDRDADAILAERLYNAKHASPFEHVLTAAPGCVYANFTGWRSMRWELGL